MENGLLARHSPRHFCALRLDPAATNHGDSDQQRQATNPPHKDQPECKKKGRTPMSLLRDQSPTPCAGPCQEHENKMERPHEHSADRDQADDAKDGTTHGRTARQRDRAPIGPDEPFFGLLPGELAVDVLVATGDVASVVNWSCTSRRHRGIANDPLVWQRLYETRFGTPLHSDFAHRDKDWQWLCRARACDGRVDGASVGEISTTMGEGGALYWGDLVDGVPHGYGLLLAVSATSAAAAATDYYEGDFYHGKFDGYGRRVWPSGDWYRGEFMGHKRHGRGTYCAPSKGTQYEGDFANSKRHGHGIYTWADGTRYEGGYAGDKRHGHGIYTSPDGTRYEGDYVDGKRHGHGIQTCPCGGRHEGRYVDNKRHGYGVYTQVCGIRYEGTYVNDTEHGRGVYTWPDGTRHEVGYRNARMHGHAASLYPDGSCIRGHYVDGNSTGNTAVTHGDRCAPTQPCMACATDPFGEGCRL